MTLEHCLAQLPAVPDRDEPAANPSLAVLGRRDSRDNVRIAILPARRRGYYVVDIRTLDDATVALAQPGIPQHELRAALDCALDDLVDIDWTCVSWRPVEVAIDQEHWCFLRVATTFWPGFVGHAGPDDVDEYLMPTHKDTGQ